MKRRQQSLRVPSGAHSRSGLDPDPVSRTGSAAGPISASRIRQVHARLDTPAALAVIAAGGAMNDADVPAGCSSCRHRTVFDNCGDPVAAGLTDVFRIVAHPQHGQGCPAYSAVNEHAGVAYWRIHLPHRFDDLAVCPPEPIEAIRRRFPSAVRIEPIDFIDVWPARAVRTPV